MFYGSTVEHRQGFTISDPYESRSGPLHTQFCFWFPLPRGRKGMVFLEMYVLSLRYLLFVTDDKVIACTMPSRVEVLLENEDQ